MAELSVMESPGIEKPVEEQSTLAGIVAIVSGSSSGIGAATARHLSQRGAQVVINYPFPSLRAEAERVCSDLTTPGVIVEADISTIGGPSQLVAGAVRHFGHVDVLVNNAAVITRATLKETTLEDWERLVNTNARGVMLLTQAVLDHLTPGRGRIINIISIASRYPDPGNTLYAGTKGMVEGFTRTWAKELPPLYGCTVNAISPGPTLTEGMQKASTEIKGLQDYIDAVSSQTPTGKRPADPSEIAYAVGMLCEEPARWINGTHILVTGGLHVD